ncbi:MAG: 30S ribosomal protein S20 [Gemmatimonadetes bacterium]|nr:30S ribosomal protein S20 [Gemmatimonadota bacterium]
MATTKSAKKRIISSRKRAERNKAVRSRIKRLAKRVREAVDAAKAQSALRTAFSVIDRAARKRLIPWNRAARLKSQLAKRVSKLVG